MTRFTDKITDDDKREKKKVFEKQTPETERIRALYFPRIVVYVHLERHRERGTDRKKWKNIWLKYAQRFNRKAWTTRLLLADVQLR